MTSFESIARNAYQTFCAHLEPPAPQVTLLTWVQLPERTKQAWIAAAQKMAEEISSVH